MLHSVQNSFNAGELSPYVSARPELEVSQSGCKSMKNFIALPYGGARYRAGTELIGPTKSGGKVRIFGFEFSTSDRHILEFGDGYIRFFNTGLTTAAPVLVDGVPVEVATPYSVDDLRELQFAQLNDIVIITHVKHPPYKLSRYASTIWVMEIYLFKSPPFMDVEVDNNKAITANGVDGTVILTAASSIFNANHVGADFELAYRRKEEEITASVKILSDGSESWDIKEGRSTTVTNRTNLKTSEILRVNGSFTIQSFGTWACNIEVFRRFLGETNFEAYLFFSGVSDRNINELYTLDEEAEIVISLSSVISHSRARVVISVSDPFIRGRVKITAVTNGTTAAATVTKKLVSGTCTEWSESAFSNHRGYPRAVTFHGQRLWFAGTKSRPQTVWASRIDSYDTFARSFGTDDVADADAPIALQLFAEQHNRIEWLSSNRALLAGTSAGEFVITGGTNENSVSVNDYSIKRHSSNGSSSVQALPVDSAVIFIQRQGRRLRKMGYKFEDDSYAAEDVTIYNEHLTRGNLVELAFQRQREPIIWGITEDGRMVGWTYRTKQPFFAAYEIKSPGATYESVAVVYGDGDEDEHWQVVKRDTGRYIERTRPDQILAQEQGDLTKLWFLDSAKEYTGSTALCTGLEHLEGKEVQIFSDGSYAGKATVAAGKITNPTPTAARTLVGVHYGGEVETMPIETQTENGTSQGRTKQGGRAVARLFQSLTGEMFTSQNKQATRFLSLHPQQSIVAARDLIDFDEVLEMPTGATRSLSVGVRQTHPYPMTVLAIIARVNITENA